VGEEMRYIAIALILTLVGCSRESDHIQNVNTIREAKMCVDAGMDYYIGDWGRVFCTKPSGKKDASN